MAARVIYEMGMFLALVSHEQGAIEYRKGLPLHCRNSDETYTDSYTVEIWTLFDNGVHEQAFSSLERTHTRDGLRPARDSPLHGIIC